ncbi:BTAD domain-containing putative transcriptional regulator [Lentzea sp. BCCO 10_0798]|uniref:BTAD domain-containing putative transcriptional regulator n=1 Tax=Lentzea kristufekii TaxID=3095430 RepID=A0ABU4U226_9PSEU|nr:BTAD domain-containing putative transcriptional regulator [Lentzea sp. BCCO 10_0798]MDX8054566.1 BTAD domain-containing putative transcriptional regulator [Lentzea sp. BCCO 10_0798]
MAVPAGRGRVLLATLLLRANEFVPVDELVERVWDGEPPAPGRAHKTLQTVVLRLRQALGAANCVRTSSRGYSAEVGPGQLDLARFRELTARGEHRAALELWRGPVLGNVTSEALHRDDVPRLVEEQVVALERRIDEDLARSTDVLVPELWSLVRQHPLRETFWAQLMLALHRAGRQAEALTVYQEVREHLADELGVDPGQRLREAHEQVLSGEVPASPVVPRQLPPAHPHFAGREHELARLTEIAGARPGEPVLISAITGIGGVGKTALAVQWAHQVADRFPDGQLYVNLRGFDLRAEPLDPVAVARDFLVALGAPANELPSSSEAVIAEYRSLLARRRMLVVLDNARDVDQVRPLLPGGPGKLVLVTSRNRLSGLVVREGAQPTALDVMDEQAATDLLTERIGAARITAEPDAVARLLERCAGLPLALGIVAARAAYGDPLAALAEELEQERLDALDIDDPTTGVRHVFSWSLRSVSEPAAEVFVVLGRHPGPEFTVEAAASLAAVSGAEAQRALSELTACSLVTRTNTGRYLLHDLLRDYAAERFGELSQERQAEAQQRMFDHYVHSSLKANRMTESRAVWTPLAPPSPKAVIAPVPDVRAAKDWFRIEQSVLLGVLTEMVAAGVDDFVWRLAYTLHLPLLRQGLLAEAEGAEVLALAAAQRRNDVFGQQRLHRALGGIYIAKRAFPEAELHLRAALRCEEEMDNVNGQADVSRGLAHLYEEMGHHDRSLETLSRLYPRIAELDVFQRGSYLASYARALHQAGEREHAIELCREAEASFELDTGSLAVPHANNAETLGDIYMELARYAEAVDSYRLSVDRLRAMHHTYYLGEGLVRLARAQIAVGEVAAAREHLAEALSIYEKLRHRGTDEARELLASVTNV